jgi:hypothetical protein
VRRLLGTEALVGFEQLFVNESKAVGL